MKPVTFQGKTLIVDGTPLVLPYAVRDAFMLGDKVVVLLDPDSYLSDPSYGKDRRRGNSSLHNLVALTCEGNLIWEAEFPEQADYFYKVISRSPLCVLSFSSFRCEIDPQTGRILQKEFLK